MKKNLMFNVTFREILDRLKEIEGAKFDSDVAVPLEITKRNLANYKERGSIPWDKIFTYCRKNKVSMEWLVNGRGPQKNTDFGISEPCSIYKVETDQDAVYDISAQVYAELVEQNKTADPDKFRQLVKLLHRQMLDTGNVPSYETIKEMVYLI